jgi:hypothetical protein
VGGSVSRTNPYAVAILSRVQRGCRFNCRRAERRGWRAVDHKLQIDAVVGELQKVEFLELRLEFADKIRNIFYANSKGND